MTPTSYTLPGMIALLCLIIFGLCFMKANKHKWIRKVAIVTISFMNVPVIWLFTNIIVASDKSIIEWSITGWKTHLIGTAGTIQIPFSIVFSVDLFTSWMLLMTTVVALVAILMGNYIKTRQKFYYILTLLIYLVNVLILLSTYAWTSLVGLMLCATLLFFMSGIWSKAESYSFITRFIFIQSIGFVFITISLFLLQYVVINYEEHTLILQRYLFYIEDYKYLSISQIGYRNLAVIMMLIGLAFLMPLVGFHRTMIDLFKHVQYPVLISVVGLYLPLIAYVTKDFLYILFVDYIPSIKPYIIVACVIHIALMAINLWKTNHIKTWAGYLILASIPIIYILLVSGALVTVSFSLMGIISFMLTSCLLLSVMASLNERQKLHTLDELKGLFTDKPYLASTVVFTLLAVIGFPVFSQFFTLFHTFYAVYDFNILLFVVCTLAICLITINIFLHFSKLFDKKIVRVYDEQTDLRYSEILPQTILVSLVLVLGIYPSVFLNEIEFYVETMLDWVYEFNDVIIWDTAINATLFIGESIVSNFQFGLASLSVVTLVIMIWLASKQRQKLLIWVLWTASHFISVGIAILVVSVDLTSSLLWKQIVFYGLSVILIYLGTHFLLSRHMHRSQYDDAIHYEGLYFKNKKMFVLFLWLMFLIIGLPFTVLGLIRYDIIAQLFLARYILLAVAVLVSFVFVMRPIWFWMAYITFPVLEGNLLNKKEQIEDWTWTKLENNIIIGVVSINTLLYFIYILL